jgi:hypothetical protein
MKITKRIKELLAKLNDGELIELTNKVGIKFKLKPGQKLIREDYEMVIDEADREDFYREYRKILKVIK